MWENDTSKSQIKKLQNNFKKLRSQFKLPDPDSKENNHTWGAYNRVLKSIQKKMSWKSPQKRLSTRLPSTRNKTRNSWTRVVDILVDKMYPRYDFIVHRQLVTYLILTDTASRPEFVDLLMSDGVNVLEANTRFVGRRVKTRGIRLHTKTSKNGPL
jgi:hypothetical protein